MHTIGTMTQRAWTAATALLLLCSPSVSAASRYSEYIYAPSQRTLVPASVYQANGSVSNPSALTLGGSGTTTLHGASAVTYDYGKNIGGLVSFTVDGVNGSDNYVGISFSESSLWISPDGSDATQNVGIDETIWFAVSGPGHQALGDQHQRGGFRYLNVYHNGSGAVALSSLSTNFTAMPARADDALRDYTGWFHCDDERLNRVWYAAAYTDQLCTIPAAGGNSLVDLGASAADATTYWWANSTLTNGSSALVDGAKRDKLIWPGDFSISLPGVFLSTNDQPSLRLSVAQLFAEQNATTGRLPYAATPIYTEPPDAFFDFLQEAYSYTYHMYNLLALNNYYVYSGDIAFLEDNWYRFKLGLNLSLQSVDSTGLAYVAEEATADWLRQGMGARNIEANSILAYTLTRAMNLAQAVGDTALVPTWQTYYDDIVAAANELLWDESAGLYTDNQTTSLHPQDGNSWAVVSGVATGQRAVTVSEALAARWGPYGAPAPEAGTTVSPFISGFELQAHFIAGQPQRALDLMRSMWWGFMMDDPRMTNSTFLEGYDVSGALHYPAYADDARISHAHGWSTGPLIALSEYAAGLRLTGYNASAGAWAAHPQPGDLASVDAGFETALGAYAAVWTNTSSAAAGGNATYAFDTPAGTRGTLRLDVPGCSVQVRRAAAAGNVTGTGMDTVVATTTAADGSVTADDLAGGRYVAEITCGGTSSGGGVPPVTGGGPSTRQLAWTSGALAVAAMFSVVL
ncbi:alpha-L-rhamnosidase [Xylariaceae sp. FL0804]|nr:alpha-L-rhamnosidase [Xylariaceae sp. FL0804]